MSQKMPGKVFSHSPSPSLKLTHNYTVQLHNILYQNYNFILNIW